MKKDANLYNFTQSLQGVVWQAGFKHHQANLSDEEKANQPTLPNLFQIRGGYAESPAWMMVQAAEFDPEPLSVERFRQRAVYSSPSLTFALLELLASEKWLDRKGEDYHLTATGRDVLNLLSSRRVKPFFGFEPLPQADLRRFVDLCQRVLDASMKADTATWSLAHSRNRAPQGANIPLIAQYIQFGSDFNAFRDDAHMAAFGSHDVQGHVWEAFMYIATEQAKNADDLYQHLAYRGFYTEDWQAALDDLSARGWISGTISNYALTENGQSVREDVEEKTDAYFYAPWNIFNDAEFEEFIQLMQALNDACQSIING